VDLKATIQQVETLPSPDFIIHKIVEIASSPTSSAKELNQVVSKDPSFVAKILRLSNSAYYGLPKKVSKLTDAIMILGFKTVRNMALSIFTKEQYFTFKSQELELSELWKHSMAVATVAETVAERIGYSNKEELFMCGLLHDIGKTVQGMLFPDLFDSIIQVARTKKISYYDAEILLKIPTHEIFSEILLAKWNFPEIVLSCTSRHHRPFSVSNSIYTDPIYITNVSTFIAEKIKYGNNGSSQPIKLELDLWNDLGLSPLTFKEIIESTEKKLEKIEEFVQK